MANIMRYDPFREALRLNAALEQFWGPRFVRPNWAYSDGATFAAPIDVRETEQGYEVKAQIPGVKAEDIELTIKDNVLTLKAGYNEEKQDEQGNWKVREIRRGSFARAISFSKEVNAEQITTSYENGVLTVTAPYSEESRARKISVTTRKDAEQAEPEAEAAGAR